MAAPAATAKRVCGGAAHAPRTRTSYYYSAVGLAIQMQRREVKKTRATTGAAVVRGRRAQRSAPSLHCLRAVVCAGAFRVRATRRSACIFFSAARMAKTPLASHGGRKTSQPTEGQAPPEEFFSRCPLVCMPHTKIQKKNKKREDMTKGSAMPVRTSQSKYPGVASSVRIALLLLIPKQTRAPLAAPSAPRSARHTCACAPAAAP